MPSRIQRKRTKGWRMPEGTVYVGRPTVFGNPVEVAECALDDDCPSYKPKNMRGGEAPPAHHWHAAFGEQPLESSPRYSSRESAQQMAVRLFAIYFTSSPVFPEMKSRLRGRDLACWCAPGTPCHADWLIRECNKP